MKKILVVRDSNKYFFADNEFFKDHFDAEVVVVNDYDEAIKKLKNDNSFQAVVSMDFLDLISKLGSGIRLSRRFI